MTNLRQWSLLGVSAILLSGCAFAGGLSDSEQEMVADLAPSQYQPATREMRNNIETQDNFAQAAFWSQQYRLNPADLESAIKLSAAVRKMGNPGKAVEIAQTTRAMYPKDPYLTAEYAAALLASERTDDAITALDDGLRVAPAYARLWSLKGAALDQKENYDLARRHYSRALQITPNDPNVMSNLGLSYALAGDPQSAEAWLRRAAAQPGAGDGIRQNLALVMQLQGKQPAQTQTVPSQAKNSAPGTYRQAPKPYQTYSAPNRPEQSARAQHSAPRQSPSFESRSAKTKPQQSYRPRPTQKQAMRPRTAQPQYSKPAARSPSSGDFGHRSNFTVTGDQSGAPRTAAEAARAAAARSKGQNRKVVVPMGQSPSKAEQGDILSQIAQNVGPRSAGQSGNLYPGYRPQPAAPAQTPPQSQYQPPASQETYAPQTPKRRRGAARRR